MAKLKCYWANCIFNGNNYCTLDRESTMGCFLRIKRRGGTNERIKTTNS